MSELGNTLANFSHFQVNVTHDIHKFSGTKLRTEIKHIVMKNEIDFALTAMVIASEDSKVFGFTMQLGQSHQQLYVRPSGRYNSNWHWFFEVITFVPFV